MISLSQFGNMLNHISESYKSDASILVAVAFSIITSLNALKPKAKTLQCSHQLTVPLAGNGSYASWIKFTKNIPS